MFYDLEISNFSTNWSTGEEDAEGEEGALSALGWGWSDAPEQRLTRTGHSVVAVILGFIMVFGFLNNVVVLVLFCRFKTLRTPVNLLLLNISVSDMLVCVCGTSLSFAASVHGRWLVGRRGCMWYGFVNSCFGIVSLISLVVLSYERYSTLTVYNKQAPDYRKPLLAVGGSWLYSLLWTVPPLLGWSSYGLEGAGTSCSVTWTSKTLQSHSYIICLFIFCLGIPVLIMMYCYSRLLCTVKQVGRFRKTAARRREYHILFMVVTTVVCYLVCWMPYGVVAMTATFGRPGLITPVVSVVPSLLAKSSTVFNPIIYILMNKQFYRCFLILFHCKHSSHLNGHSMPSRTTVIQLNRRLCSNTVTGNIPTSLRLNTEISTPVSDRTHPPQITP
ncbi:teleost multiple tissue opsin 2a [Astyanax mexicanus]|uniref:Teleost multiple tissue opsin 2a n=2 Tax=Astyanax mexicanus TaxID=7994 RepID=A0A8B9L2E9_ASTMX|nr:teleost multiple tissue opsin 2a [Astyanax mexicanus]AHA91710.1 teleost multiple tissue opsin [Astyanax mexicanus]KAG9277929.1 teleost multiple tissue opsin 2a [Astyanax mexicanus]